MKKIFILAVSAIFLAAASGARAVPQTVSGFICPVFNDNSQAGTSNPNAVPIGGGDYTILGPNVSVPIHATNQNGAGSPGGTHASPGEAGYTPIWNTD